MRVNRDKKISKEWSASVWGKFKARLQAASDQDADRLLALLFTNEEKGLIIRRLTAMTMLRDNQTYREIRDVLGLSYNTIRALQSGLHNGKYVGWVKAERLYKKKKTISIRELHHKPEKGAIEKFLIDLALLKVDPKARWRFLNH